MNAERRRVWDRRAKYSSEVTLMQCSTWWYIYVLLRGRRKREEETDYAHRLWKGEDIKWEGGHNHHQANSKDIKRQSANSSRLSHFSVARQTPLSKCAWWVRLVKVVFNYSTWLPYSTQLASELHPLLKGKINKLLFSFFIVIIFTYQFFDDEATDHLFGHGSRRFLLGQ